MVMTLLLIIEAFYAKATLNCGLGDTSILEEIIYDGYF